MEAQKNINNAAQIDADTYTGPRGRYFDYYAMMGIVRSTADATTDLQHQEVEEQMKLLLEEMANDEISSTAAHSVPAKPSISKDIYKIHS